MTAPDFFGHGYFPLAAAQPQPPASQPASTCMSDGSARTVRVGVDGKLSTLSFDASSLTVTREGTPPFMPCSVSCILRLVHVPEGNRKVVQVPLRQVLWAHVLGDTIEVHVLAGKKKGAPLSLVNINSKVQGSEQENAAKWVEELLDGAYRGAPALHPVLFL